MVAQEGDLWPKIFLSRPRRRVAIPSSAPSLARYAWRNVYPLSALVAGVFFLVGVDQTRKSSPKLVVDIRELVRLEATRVLHATFFVLF